VVTVTHDFLADKVDTLRQDLETSAKVDKLDTDFDRALTEIVDNISSLNTLSQCQELFQSEDFKFYWLTDTPAEVMDLGHITPVTILERHLYDYLYTEGSRIIDEIKDRLEAEAEDDE
jgi:hypothetical protein